MKNKLKLKDYKLTGSIHTIAIKSPGIVEYIQEDVSKCIISNSRSKTTDGQTTTSIINVNKLMGDIYSFSEFNTTLDTILAGAGINEYDIIRADMRFDSYNKNFYKQYAKLNRYLISALAVTYKVNNTYRSTNLFKQNQLSISIKNRYFECEYYDKAEESGGTDIAESRLEERSKNWSHKDLKNEFTVGWFNRWNKSIENLRLVQVEYNDALEQVYRSDRYAFPKRFRSLTDFLIQYQDCIFSKWQMIDLLERFPEEVKNPVSRAENHKKRYGCEYYAEDDVQVAVNEIKRATNEFFNR